MDVEEGAKERGPLPPPPRPPPQSFMEEYETVKVGAQSPAFHGP